MNPRIVRRWESFEAKREGEGERRKRKKKKKNTLRNCGATNCALKNEGEWGKTRGMIKAAISPLINFNRSAHGRPWWLIKFSGKTTFTSVPEPRYCAAYSWKIYVANATEFVVTGFRKYFSAAHCSSPNSNCFIVIAIQFNVKRKICVWENIFGDGWERTWKMYFIGCETILDFVSEICDFFSWQSLPIGDHLIPIPWRAWRTRAGNWDLWSNFALCQKWFFSSKG